MTDKKKDEGTPGPMELSVRPATGKPRAGTQSHRDLFDFVKVGYLKRDYTWGPIGNQVTYGPGTDIEIPEPLAAQLGLTGKRASQSLTRKEEQDAGVHKEKADKDGTGGPIIPVSDPEREGPSQQEIQAANEAQGTTTEQITARLNAAEEPPRARSASAPKAK